MITRAAMAKKPKSKSTRCSPTERPAPTPPQREGEPDISDESEASGATDTHNASNGEDPVCVLVDVGVEALRGIEKLLVITPWSETDGVPPSAKDFIGTTSSSSLRGS